MNLLGKATDAAFWSETVRNGDCYREFRKYLCDTWQADCEGQEITELKYSTFKIFFENGNRSIYESQYFKRRRALAASALLSLVYPEEEKYITKLQDVIFAICDEYTWCLPAHHPNLEENNRTFIDLFASETGFALSEIYTLLGERMDKVISERIKAEVNYRIINSFINKNDYWWEVRCTNNWAAVCGGSVGCTFILMRPELFDEVKPRFDYIMEKYLKGFFDDGFCLEGTGYWHYGFGFFTVYADMVKTFTEGETDYFARERVKRISTFIQKMFLSEKASVSFADGYPEGHYHFGLCHYLKKKYPEEVKVYSPKYGYVADNCARFCLILNAAVWLDPDIYNNPADNENAEYFGEDAGWFVKRTASYGFAAKGGTNGEHHNHNDVGNFIFAKNGRQVITDVGSGKYSKQYFRPETRYTFIETSSKGHSLPFFGDEEQKVGKAFGAAEVCVSEGKFSLDIAGAYGIEALTKLNRSFGLKDDEITLTDTFEYTSDTPITERFVTYIEPKIEGGEVILEDTKLIFEGVYPTVTATETSKNKTLYFIDFILPCDTKTFTLTIK